jgi:hypothetical protein
MQPLWYSASTSIIAPAPARQRIAALRFFLRHSFDGFHLKLLVGGGCDRADSVLHTVAVVLGPRT